MFTAWFLNITWLFLGLLILFILTSGSISISVVTILGICILFQPFIDLREYWFVVMFGIAAFILLVEGRKKEPSGGEYYSPELMSLLGGGG